MKRFRLSTLMLLIVIAALGVALVVQQQRAARREAESRIRIQTLRDNSDRISIENKELRFRMEQMGKGAK
jgi:hypothetical protein